MVPHRWASLLSPERHVRGQLLAVYLTELNFRRNFEFDLERHDPSYGVETTTRVEVAADLASAVAHLEASIAWFFDEDTEERLAEDRQHPFDLSLTVTGMFDWMETTYSEEDIAGWTEFNAEHLLWPYLRAHVSTITAASDLPPLTIYTIAIPRPRLGRIEETATGG